MFIGVVPLESTVNHISMGPVVEAAKEKFDVTIIPAKFGYVYSYKSAKELQQTFELATTTRFVTYKTSKNFGKTAVVLKSHRIWWEDVRKQGIGTLEFDGVPYIQLGHRLFDCHYGGDRNKAKKQHERKAKNAHPDLKKRRSLSQETKKIGCPAKLEMREIMKFPEYKVAENKKKLRRTASERLRSAMTSGEVCGERRIYIYLPSIEEHSEHPTGEVAAHSQRLDSRVIDRIHQLSKSESVRTVAEVKHQLDGFVRDELFQNQHFLPSENNRRFFPKPSDIRFHMYYARIKNGLKSSPVTGKRGCSSATDWQESSIENITSQVFSSSDDEQKQRQSTPMFHSPANNIASEVQFCTLMQELVEEASQQCEIIDMEHPHHETVTTCNPTTATVSQRKRTHQSRQVYCENLAECCKDKLLKIQKLTQVVTEESALSHCLVSLDRIEKDLEKHMPT